MNGENAISKDVVANLGNAKNGPMTRYKPIVNMYAYVLLTLDVISKIPFVLDIPIAIIPKNGNPIAVIKKPKLAINTFDPAVCPR